MDASLVAQKVARWVVMMDVCLATRDDRGFTWLQEI